MRNFALVLLVVATGCAFHVQGTTPPGAGDPTPITPINPGTPGGGTPTDPTNPSGNPTPPVSGTPTPPPTASVDAGAMSTPDMRPAPLSAHVGDACNEDEDCASAGVAIQCLHDIGKGKGSISLPSGYCSKACDSKTPCPTGSECIATLFGPFCMQSCPAAGCRVGYACCKTVNACGLAQFCG